MGAIASVGWWRFTDLTGVGDLRPYLLLQALPIVLIPLWQALYDRPRGERWAFAGALLLYAIAKFAELHDHQIAASLGAITGHEKQAAERIAAFDKQLAQVKQQMTLPPQPVNAIVYTAAAHSANLWTAESAQGKLLHQLGFTLADLPAGLQTSTSQGKRHDIIQLGGENLATGLNGEGLFVFAGDQKDVDAIYANPLLAHLPSVKNKRVWALGTETFRLDYYSAMLVLQRLNAMFK